MQVLDADQGAGWNLAAGLLRPRQVQASLLAPWHSLTADS